MTCIVGIAIDGKVYIGGDSAGVDASGSYDLTVRADEKVFYIENRFVIGFTTSFRMGQLLRYAFKPPEKRHGQDLMHYMVTDFVNALRACLKESGWAVKKEEQEKAGTFLVGCEGRLFAVYDDYQVAEPVCGYEAIGCGFQVAKGAVFALKNEFQLDKDPESIVLRALCAAEAHNAGVRGPFHVLPLE